MAYQGDIEEVDPYDCNNEPHPDNVVFSNEFKELTAVMSQARSMLLDPLRSSDYTNAILGGLVKEVEKRTRVDSSSQNEVMFAISGDMASGKSSVINSILSTEPIAKKGDAGGSCTWVVQRFMNTFRDQTSPYEARVRFFDQKEVHDIFASLLKKYYRALPPGDGDEEDREEQDEKGDNFNEIHTVIENFTAMFCDKPEFEDYACAKEYLDNFASSGHEELLDQLTEWVQEAIDGCSGDSDFVSVTGVTASELLFNLQPYTFSLQDSECGTKPCLWPIVSVIDIGLKHPLLAQGTVFVDTPGVSDANVTRAHNALVWQRKCSHKIVVAQIGRAKDDKSMSENLKNGYCLRGSGNTVLVLTHCDEIDIDPEDPATTSSETEKQLRTDLSWLSAEKKRLVRERSRVTEGKKKDEISQDIQAIREEYDTKLSELMTFCLNSRNKSVAKGIQQKYSEMTGDLRPLAIFTVGNKAYRQHVQGFAANKAPPLSVAQTEIPALRNLLYLLPSSGKWNAAANQAFTQLPNLINTFELYCSKSHLTRKGEIEAIVKRPATKLNSQLREFSVTLNQQSTLHLFQYMEDDVSRWSTQARRLYRGLENGLPASTQLAIFRREGYRPATRRGGPAIDWNAKLLELHEPQMSKAFEELKKTIKPAFDMLQKTIAKQLEIAGRQLKNDEQFNLLALKPLSKKFKYEQKNMEIAIKEARRDLIRTIGEMEQDATDIHPTSYLMQIMRPIYGRVASMTARAGGGPQARRKTFEHLLSKIEGGVWSTMQSAIRYDLEKALADSRSQLHASISRVMNNVHASFQLLCASSEVTDPAEKIKEEAIRAKLQESLTEARTLVEGRIRELADHCESRALSSRQA